LGQEEAKREWIGPQEKEKTILLGRSKKPGDLRLLVARERGRGRKKKKVPGENLREGMRGRLTTKRKLRMKKKR